MAKYCKKSPADEIENDFHEANGIIHFEKITCLARYVLVNADESYKWRMNNTSEPVILNKEGVPTEYITDSTETLLQKLGAGKEDVIDKLNTGLYATAIYATRQKNLKVGESTDFTYWMKMKNTDEVHLIHWVVVRRTKDMFFVLVKA